MSVMPALPHWVPLEEGETVLWAGKPDPYRRARQGCSTFVMGLIFMAPTFFVAFYVRDFVNAFFTIPFLLAGLWLAGEPWRQYENAVRTTYAVTDRRMLAIAGGKTAESSPEVRLRHLQLVERRSGRGDLFLGWLASGSEGAKGAWRQVGFFDIAEVRQVHRIVVDMLINLERAAG